MSGITIFWKKINFQKKIIPKKIGFRHDSMHLLPKREVKSQKLRLRSRQKNLSLISPQEMIQPRRQSLDKTEKSKQQKIKIFGRREIEFSRNMKKHGGYINDSTSLNHTKNE